jgi:hypothetical protein
MPSFKISESYALPLRKLGSYALIFKSGIVSLGLRYHCFSVSITILVYLSLLWCIYHPFSVSNTLNSIVYGVRTTVLVYLSF